MSTVSGVESSSVTIMWLDPERNPVMMDNDRVTTSPTISTGNGMFARSLNFAYLMEGDYGDVGTYTCDVMILDASGAALFVIESLIGQYAINVERFIGLNFQFLGVP